jgi:geranylgeranyl reductase family protein
VVVVGGGPAGSSCAALLSRAGFDVLLIDRARFPRDKPCGEFLTQGAEDALRSIGAWERVRTLLRPIPSIEVRSPGGAAAAWRPESGETAGWSVRRDRFDLALSEHAANSGADVITGATVRELLQTNGRIVGVEAHTGGAGAREIRARLTIGADGAHSVVARRLGVVRPIPRLRRVAIVSHWTGADSSGGLVMGSDGRSVCGFGPLPEDEANVTLVISRSEASRISGRTEEFLVERLHLRFPAIWGRLREARLRHRPVTVGCFGHYARRAYSDGAMLVGDAATFIDPFSGEGVYFALRGAELAAAVAATALAAGDTSRSALAAYQLRRRELLARYRLCDAVQLVIRTPWLADRAIGALARSPALGARLMEVLADRDSPRQVVNAGFLYRLLAAG